MEQKKSAKIIKMVTLRKDNKAQLTLWARDVFAELNHKLEEHFQPLKTTKQKDNEFNKKRN